MKSMISMMLSWWYGAGWKQTFQRIRSWPKGIGHIFSLKLLLKTLFAPWRRIVTLPGKSFDQKMRAMLDNLISRCVGFGVRISVLLAALGGMVIAFASAIVLAIIWPLLPFSVLFFIVRSITG